MLLDLDYTKYRGWLREATTEDLQELAPRLRADDKREILATAGLPAELVLPHYTGEHTFVAGVKEDDTPEVVLGYYPVMGCENEVAVVWMLSSDKLFEYPQRFAPVSRAIYDRLHTQYPLLTNFIDERNTRHIAWLKWLGFQIIRRIDKFGPFSLPFLEFVSYRKCVSLS